MLLRQRPFDLSDDMSLARLAIDVITRLRRFGCNIVQLISLVGVPPTLKIIHAQNVRMVYMRSVDVRVCKISRTAGGRLLLES